MNESDATLNQGAPNNGATLRSSAESYAPAVSVERSASSAGELLRRIFSFPAMLGAVLVGAVYLFARAFIVDPDCWWHIKTGELILATHQFPHTDPYSFFSCRSAVARVRMGRRCPSSSGRALGRPSRSRFAFHRARRFSRTRALLSGVSLRRQFQSRFRRGRDSLPASHSFVFSPPADVRLPVFNPHPDRSRAFSPRHAQTRSGCSRSCS